MQYFRWKDIVYEIVNYDPVTKYTLDVLAHPVVDETIELIQLLAGCGDDIEYEDSIYEIASPSGGTLKDGTNLYSFKFTHKENRKAIIDQMGHDIRVQIDRDIIRTLCAATGVK